MYITKYALTKGIIEAEPKDPEVESSIGGIVHFRHSTGYDYYHFYGKDVFDTLSEAQEVAEKMRLKKIRSLKKQLKKYEAMSFVGD